MKRAASPVRALLALALAVLAVHLWLLQGAPDLQLRPEPAAARSFSIRTIASAAAPVAAPAPPSGPASVKPPVRRALRDPQPGMAAAAPPLPVAIPIAAPSPVAAEPAPAPAVAALQVASFAVPGPRRLRYKVSAQTRGVTLHGEGELLWRHDGSSYEASLEVRAPLLPTRRQRSTGRITSEGLAPQRFSDKVRSEEAAHFERDKGEVSFSSNRPAAALMAGAQDRLSVLLQLGAMAAAEPAQFRPGRVIGIQTAGTRDAEQWLFTVEGEEQLQLPGGSVKALKLTRNPRKEFDQKVELWLGVGMDYVPVRLRLTQPNGDWLDQQWTSTDKG